MILPSDERIIYFRSATEWGFALRDSKNRYYHCFSKPKSARLETAEFLEKNERLIVAYHEEGVLRIDIIYLEPIYDNTPSNVEHSYTVKGNLIRLAPGIYANQYSHNDSKSDVTFYNFNTGAQFHSLKRFTEISHDHWLPLDFTSISLETTSEINSKQYYILVIKFINGETIYIPLSLSNPEYVMAYPLFYSESELRTIHLVDDPHPVDISGFAYGFIASDYAKDLSSKCESHQQLTKEINDQAKNTIAKLLLTYSQDKNEEKK